MNAKSQGVRDGQTDSFGPLLTSRLRALTPPGTSPAGMGGKILPLTSMVIGEQCLPTACSGTGRGLSSSLCLSQSAEEGCTSEMNTFRPSTIVGCAKMHMMVSHEKAGIGLTCKEWLSFLSVRRWSAAVST